MNNFTNTPLQVVDPLDPCTIVLTPNQKEIDNYIKSEKNNIVFLINHSMVCNCHSYFKV